MGEKEKHLIQVIDAHKKDLKNKYSIAAISVFGSVSKGISKPDSDIDILVEFHKTPGLFGFVELKQYLENILGISVDLVTEDALKKQFRDEIIKDAIRVA